MRQIRPARSKAHGFSAFSTALGVGLTLGILGAFIAGALVVRELRQGWWALMAVQVVLEDGINGDDVVKKWMAEEAVAQAVFLDADSASAEMERELGEPFMDFLGTSPLPAMVEIRLNPDWVGRSGTEGLAALVSQWESREGVVRVAYPRRVLDRLDRGFSDWTVPLSLLLVVFMAVAVAQIFNVVRLSVFGRRQLIRSMDLVGAPPRRIRRPFIAEAMGYGLVGAILAYAAVVGLLGMLKPYLFVLQSWGAEQLVFLFVLQVAMGLLMTGLSARWAVARYLGARLDKLV